MLHKFIIFYLQLNDVEAMDVLGIFRVFFGGWHRKKRVGITPPVVDDCAVSNLADHPIVLDDKSGNSPAIS